jgi:hypothetical protein
MTDEERNEMPDEASEVEEDATTSDTAEEEKAAPHPQPDPIRDY